MKNNKKKKKKKKKKKEKEKEKTEKEKEEKKEKKDIGLDVFPCLFLRFTVKALSQTHMGCSSRRAGIHRLEAAISHENNICTRPAEFIPECIPADYYDS